MPNEWTLAIETSVTDASVALCRDGQLVARRNFTSERSQECDLFEPLGSILSELPNDEGLQTVVVGTGPGSYNGARVGIAAAQALAQVHQCGVAGLCSFEGVEIVNSSPRSWAAGDARRGSFFLMEMTQGRVTSEPNLLKESEFLNDLAGITEPVVTFESPDRLPGNHPVQESTSNAETLIRSWLSRSPSEKQSLLAIPAEAFYLRPPHITKSKKKLL